MGRVLDDIRVLDLTHAVFGPFCNMVLAGFGAEVIKIEPPWGALGRIRPTGMVHGASTGFYAVNVNKKGMAIDLKHPKGVTIFKELVKKSDVVMQNFVPGTMERLGLGYDVLKELNPKIIYAALSGFGQTGPNRLRPSYAPIAEAISGHSRATGDRVDPEGPPINMAGAIGDVGPAMWAAVSVLAAIRYRDKTGVGQMIDVAQADCMTAYNTGSIVSFLLTGMTSVEMMQKYPGYRRGFSGIMKVKDGWIQVAGMRLKAIENMKKKIGVDEVTSDMVREIVSEMTSDEAVDYMVEVGAPVAPVYSVRETVKDPHLIARGMFIEVEHPKAGRITVPNFPVKLSESPGAGPRLARSSYFFLIYSREIA
jgi:CoA:oxalate CoA-transferase